MRALGLALLIAALLLVGLRLFTGIVYRADTPVAALVVKHRPALAVERPETAQAPLDRDTLLDQEEPTLFYAPVYLAAMHAAPVAAPVMAVAGVLLRRRRRRA